jgi:hypothetical protein
MSGQPRSADSARGDCYRERIAMAVLSLLRLPAGLVISRTQRPSRQASSIKHTPNAPPGSPAIKADHLGVVAAVLSMKVSRFGSKGGGAYRKPSRASAPSSRFRSAARTLFF